MAKGMNTVELADAQMQAVAMHLDGATMGAIQKATGLNYSQAWLGIANHYMALPEYAHLNRVGQYTGAALGQAVAEARNAPGEPTPCGLSNSWGWLAVRFGMPESRVRSLYEATTNVASTGLRIGKGGRFAGGLEDQYVGEARVHGVAREVGTGELVANPQAVAVATAPTPAPAPAAEPVGAGPNMASLRKQARALGMPNPGKANRATLLAWLASNASA